MGGGGEDIDGEDLVRMNISTARLNLDSTGDWDGKRLTMIKS